MISKKIIAVSAGKYISKKNTKPFDRKILYLNYGLLGLATMISERGYDISMFHGFGSPLETINEIYKNNIDFSKSECVLLSIPSNLCLTWSVDFCRLVKEITDIPIIVGGRWVIDGQLFWIKQKIKYADLFIEGFGEKKIAELFNFHDKNFVADGSEKCFDFLDYRLLNDYQKIQPSIEISRGCGSGCRFCADRSNKRVKNKSVDKILKEMDFLDDLYGDKYKVYFEAPHFIFEKEWTNQYCSQAVKRNRIVPWRCTSRVETVPDSDEMIAMLAESGLKLIDIGLESASPSQLKAMHKTNSPEKFLAKTEKILEVCKKYGIWIKLNILLYAGETMKTIKETSDWLLQRKELIKGVSCANLICYQNSNNLQEFAELGASIPDYDYYKDNGFSGMNLSSEINLEKALELCSEIPKIIMTARDYYDIKEHSYFQIGYEFKDFLNDIKNCAASELPFNLNEYMGL